MAIWSYQIRPLSTSIGEAEKQLIHLGEDGWELVSILHHPNPTDFMATVGIVNSGLFAFLKKDMTKKVT